MLLSTQGKKNKIWEKKETSSSYFHQGTRQTNRQTSIGSEAIPFGPQTHHTLRRGFPAACRQAGRGCPIPVTSPSPRTRICAMTSSVGKQSYSCGFCSALQTCLSPAPVHHNSLTPNPAPPLPSWVPLPSTLSEPCFGYSSFSALTHLWAQTRHLWFSTSTSLRSNNTGIISGLVFSDTSLAAGRETLVCVTQNTQRTGITQSCLCCLELCSELLFLPIYTFT